LKVECLFYLKLILFEINFFEEFFTEFGLSKKHVENQVNLYLKFRKELKKELNKNLTNFTQITQAIRDGETTLEEILKNNGENPENLDINIRRFAKISEFEEKKTNVKISDLVDLLDFLNKEELFIWWMDQTDLDKYPIKSGTILFDPTLANDRASQTLDFRGSSDPVKVKIVIGEGYVINNRLYPRLDKIGGKKLNKNKSTKIYNMIIYKW